MTLKVREICKEGARPNPLADFFNQMLEELGLCNVEPLKLVPTLRNFQSVKERVSK